MPRAQHANASIVVERASSPWESRDIRFLGAACLLGSAALLVSWYGASRSLMPAEEWVWFEVGLGGLALMAIAEAVWFLRGRRAVGIVRALIVPGLLDPDESAADARPVASAQRGLVAGAGMSRFHRPECAFVAGRDLGARPRAEHVHAGLRPCEVCEP
jgi:hypothetical protein